MGLSYPAFPPRPKAKLCNISHSSFPLAHLGFPQPGQPQSTWMLLILMLGSALCASDMGLLSKAEPSAKWAPAPRPLQPADNLQLVCNCCVNTHFLSLMILAPLQGSTRKGTEQWDVIVLKCAQQEALLHHALRPRLYRLKGLMEFSCSLQFIINQVLPWLLVLPAQLLKKNKGEEKRKEKRQPQNIHCITIWTGKREKKMPWVTMKLTGLPNMASGLQFVMRSCLPFTPPPFSPVYNHRSKWWKA